VRKVGMLLLSVKNVPPLFAERCVIIAIEMTVIVQLSSTFLVDLSDEKEDSNYP